MSIGNWFKRIFSPDRDEEVTEDTNRQMIDINEARIDAGGSGLMGVAQHDSAGEEAARRESGDF